MISFSTKFYIYFVLLISLLFLTFPTKATASSTTVILNESGFSPNSITIPKNQTVVWKIEGQNEHWPASNFHPTHTEYPETGGCVGSKLDACKGLKSGENFSFTFNKTGNWGMHDHLAPAYTMVIKVVESENAKKAVSSKNLQENIFMKIFNSLGFMKKNAKSSKQAPQERAKTAKAKCENTPDKQGFLNATQQSSRIFPTLTDLIMPPKHSLRFKKLILRQKIVIS